MSEARPTPDQVDRCLDELANAYAQGRISDSQFAERSEQILSAERVSLLDEALADLRTRMQPPSAFQAPPFSAPGVAPQPPAPFVRRPQPVFPYRPQPGRRTNRRHMFVLGGSIAFVGFLGLASLGLLGWVAASSEIHHVPPEVRVPEVSSPEFLIEGSEHVIHPHTGGVMSSIVITRSSAEVWGKPHGEPWQRRVVKPNGDMEQTDGEPGTNVFDNSEFVLAMLPGMVERTPSYLNTSAAVKKVTVIREKPNEPVRYVITTEDDGAVVWDAINPVIIETRPPK